MAHAIPMMGRGQKGFSQLMLSLGHVIPAPPGCCPILGMQQLIPALGAPGKEPSWWLFPAFPTNPHLRVNNNCATWDSGNCPFPRQGVGWDEI